MLAHIAKYHLPHCASRRAHNLIPGTAVVLSMALLSRSDRGTEYGVNGGGGGETKVAGRLTKDFVSQPAIRKMQYIRRTRQYRDVAATVGPLGVWVGGWPVLS